METINEKNLIEEARTNPEAFGVLFERYYSKIFKYAMRTVGNRQDAEDITSQTFEKAIKHMGQYDIQRGSFATWLYRIAFNTVMDYYRERGKVKMVVDDVDESELPDLASDADRIDSYVTLMNSIRKLPHAYQAVLTLKFFEQLNNDDIATILGCSKKVLAVKVFRALRALESTLGSEGFRVQRMANEV